ncbi:MAG: methyltransferase domain-containing protein [Smithellaceae bacterium]|nr:class I SAM-dependent methyltransferase [Syntrophaceae bacterium]MDD4240517.1 methyltransferase domain-containing protein [Smithellaceae bacterium]NLX51254.1 methyltransferase domain-containing protein [Deltaproteobacteria bacterium]
MLARPDRTLPEDQWLETETGRFVFSRLERLILDLVSPVTGETLLDVGCGSGNYLRLFQKRKCVLSGLEESQSALAAAREKLGNRCELVYGSAEDLPFSDNSFDVVTLIAGLHFANRPQKVIAEAIRVCRGRLFIGFFNKNYIVGTKRSIGRLFGFASAEAIRFYTLYDVRSMVKRQMAVSSLRWGSVIYLPGPFYMFFSELEEIFPMYKNPLGAYVGMVIPVRYTYRTISDPVLNSFDLKAKAQAAAPEAISEML